MSFSHTGCKSVSNHQEVGELQGLRTQSSARDGAAVFAQYTGRQVAGILDCIVSPESIPTSITLQTAGNRRRDVAKRCIPSRYQPDALPTSRVTMRALT